MPLQPKTFGVTEPMSTDGGTSFVSSRSTCTFVRFLFNSCLLKNLHDICALLNYETVWVGFQDFELDKKLRVELEPFGVFETKEEYEHRRDVLAVMNKLASDWIRDVIFERTKSKEIAEAAGGQIFTFGSFRLGVNSRGKCIKIFALLGESIFLCIPTPSHVLRLGHIVE